MIIKNQELPPNYADIKEVLNPPQDAVFAYGDFIFNPSGGIIYPDLEIHETAHAQRQNGKQKEWWDKYLSSPQFRLQEEIVAYNAQYKYLKEKVGLNNKELKGALFDMANKLSTIYTLDIPHLKAEVLIRNYGNS